MEGDKGNQVIINDDSIDFESKSIENTSDKAELSQEIETSDLPMKWHTLEVRMLGDTRSIFSLINRQPLWSQGIQPITKQYQRWGY